MLLIIVKGGKIKLYENAYLHLGMQYRNFQPNLLNKCWHCTFLHLESLVFVTTETAEIMSRDLLKNSLLCCHKCPVCHKKHSLNSGLLVSCVAVTPPPSDEKFSSYTVHVRVI